jgi:hypothetical protein
MVARAEEDPHYSGYLIMTVREGDCLVIGDSIIRLKRIKNLTKTSFAVMAKRCTLVRRVPGDALGKEEQSES